MALPKVSAMTRTFQEALAARGIPDRPGAGHPPMPRETTGLTPATDAPDSPSEALTPADGLIVDPRTGEILGGLERQPTDRLAGLVLEYRRREADLITMRKTLEAELRGRLEMQGRRQATVGDYELAVDSTRGRVWDADELENVLHELVHDYGAVTAGEVADIITRETKVNGTKARDLLNRVDDGAKALLESCFRWEQKGPPKLTVTPVAQLEAPKDVVP